MCEVRIACCYVGSELKHWFGVRDVSYEEMSVISTGVRSTVIIRPIHLNRAALVMSSENQLARWL